MEQMQEQMNAILGNPEMMQQIMSMAQSLGQSQEPPACAPSPPVLPDFDPKLLGKLSGLAKSGSIDSDQRSLLSALRPYLTSERIAKLEKAMRAAKLAAVASSFLGSSGSLFDPGR